MHSRCLCTTVLALTIGGCAKMNGQPTSAAHDKQLASAAERAAEQKPQAQPARWRQTFAVNKSELMATGSNSYLPIQPRRVLKLRHDNDSLTVTILNDTKTI